MLILKGFCSLNHRGGDGRGKLTADRVLRTTDSACVSAGVSGLVVGAVGLVGVALGRSFALATSA